MNNNLDKKLKTALAKSIETRRVQLTESFTQVLAEMFDLPKDEIAITYDGAAVVYELDDLHRLIYSGVFVHLERRAIGGRWSTVDHIRSAVELAEHIEKYRELPKWLQWWNRMG